MVYIWMVSYNALWTCIDTKLKYCPFRNNYMILYSNNPNFVFNEERSQLISIYKEYLNNYIVVNII